MNIVSDNNHYNYTIVIPHKNIPDLLKRCLLSIPQRDDLQIIIVDDNSDPKIVDFNNFPGINNINTEIIFSKEQNKGGGYARNLALKHAKGKYIIFADADDFFNNCFNDILNNYTSTTADIIFFNANSVDSKTYKPTHRVTHLNKFIKLYKSNKEKSIINLKYLFGEPWCKIIKKDIIKENNIHFDETSIHNDTTFSYLVGFYSKDVLVDERIAYCVTKRKNSVSVSLNENKKLERIYVFGKSKKFFSEHNIYVKEKRFYRQLLDSYFENKDTFNKGFNILLDLGYTKKYIIIMLIYEHLNREKKKLFKKIKNKVAFN